VSATRRALALLGLLAAAAPASPAAEDPAWSFPERRTPALPDFSTPRSRRAPAERDAPAGTRPGDDRDGIGWFAGAVAGLETVRWDVEAGGGAFPRYQVGSAPAYSQTTTVPTDTYGYGDVPDGTLPAFVALRGGLVPAPGWELGLQCGYSRTWGPEISVSHHALELQASVHPFQPWVFVRGGLGREVLAFSDDAGADVYSRFSATGAVGVTVPVRPRFTLPVALEATRSFATSSDDGLPRWASFRLTVGLSYR
jgi:hypothetical protein